jgi:4-hydroxybenzoate polyprenyltransferase
LCYNNLRLTDALNYNLILSFSLWHFALFLFDRIYDRKIDRLAQPDEYVPDYQARVLYITVGLLTMGSLVFYLMSGYYIKYWLFLLPITFLYPLKLYRDKRIKSVFLVKNLYSAVLIYSMPIYMQAFLLNGYSTPGDIVVLPIYSLFVYVMIGEIFWDIRDLSVDKANGTHTLPNTIGVGVTKVILVGMITFDSYNRGWDFSGSAIIYLTLLSFVKEKTDRLIYHLPPLIALLRFLV